MGAHVSKGSPPTPKDGMQIRVVFTVSRHNVAPDATVTTMTRNADYEMPTSAILRVGQAAKVGAVEVAVKRWLESECDLSRADQLSPMRMGVDRSAPPSTGEKVPLGVQITSWEFVKKSEAQDLFKLEFEQKDRNQPHSFFFQVGDKVEITYTLKLEKRQSADSKKSRLLPADQKKDEDGSQEEKHPVAQLVNQCMCGRKVC